MVKAKTLGVLGKEEVKAIEQDVKEYLLRVAVERTGVPREKWVIRDLLPTDLGLSTNEWSFDYSTANDYNQVIDTTLGDRVFIAIFGVAVRDPSPVATVIKFQKAAQVKDIISLEDLYVYEEPVAYFEEPIVYEENDDVDIYIYATSTKTGEKLILLGYIAELKGKTITV